MSADAADAVTAAPDAGGGDGDAAQLLDGMTEGANAEGDAGTGDSPDDTAQQLAHWKDMARKHEKRAKENSAAAMRLQKIEDANKTDLQRALDAQANAERERDDALQSHARVMAAAANNLPVELIEHLGTGTEEEITERAELFAGIIEATAQAIAEQLIADQIASGKLIDGASRNGGLQSGPGARPVESLRAGSAPAGATPNTTEQWFRQLLGQ
jgi:hypothetical protein